MARAGQPTSPRTCWRDPRRHITAERRSEKLTRHRSHPMTAEYGIASFAARREARRLNVTRADGPKPPDAAKTRGVKEAISTSRTRRSYRRRLCCSWRRKIEAVERRASFERARGLKTRTSKNTHTHTHTCTHRCVRAHTRTHTHTHTHTYTHKHARKHAHTYFSSSTNYPTSPWSKCPDCNWSLSSAR